MRARRQWRCGRRELGGERAPRSSGPPGGLPRFRAARRAAVQRRPAPRTWRGSTGAASAAVSSRLRMPTWGPEDRGGAGGAWCAVWTAPSPQWKPWECRLTAGANPATAAPPTPTCPAMRARRRKSAYRCSRRVPCTSHSVWSACSAVRPSSAQGGRVAGAAAWAGRRAGRQVGRLAVARTCRAGRQLADGPLDPQPTTHHPPAAPNHGHPPGPNVSRISSRCSSTAAATSLNRLVRVPR